MKVCAAGPHLGCRTDRLHNRFVADSLVNGKLRVCIDAERALRDVNDGHGNKLPNLGRQRPVAEHLPAERAECPASLDSQFMSSLGNGFVDRSINRFVYPITHIPRIAER